MRESPRTRRLRTDYKALEKLVAESSILDFDVQESSRGLPPEAYVLRFRGKGLWRPSGTTEVLMRELHEVHVQLGASYPRMMPELAWKSPIFHPNISASGIVCLGGYGTHWVPSLNLDELCIMLWDMIRYENFDVESPYNREAALWAKMQGSHRLPVDHRPLRDRLAGGTLTERETRPPITTQPRADLQTPEVMFLDGEEIVDAEVVEPEDSGILFIE